VDLTRQTLGGWVEAAADWLSPIYREMRAGLVAGNYLQVDETPIRYLDPDVTGKSQQGYLWTYSHPRGDVVFDWQVNGGGSPGRRRRHPWPRCAARSYYSC
jgi:transposase